MKKRDATGRGPGPGDSSPGRAHHFRSGRRRLRRWPRRLLVVANVVVFVVIASSASVVGYAVYELNRIHVIHVSHLAQASPRTVTIGRHQFKAKSKAHPPFTVLFVGSDSRAGAVHSGLDVGNTETNSENLSDSIILARVAPSSHQLALLSIPRDLWVSIPGVGMGKINSAFAGGDPSRLIEVIEQDLKIPVNHFAEVSFDSFEQIANAIGGVEQYFPTPAFDTYSGLRVSTAGCVNLEGAQALAFVRSRHYEYVEPGEEAQSQEEPESDLGRIQRQQAFIKNAINKIRRQGVLTHPTTLAALVASITGNLTVDQTFSDSQLISLAEDFRSVNASKIPNTTYPVENLVVDGTSALAGLPLADQATIDQFMSVGTEETTTGVPATTTTVPTSGGSAPATTTTVAHGGISVAVINGSGVANQASTAGAALAGAGYTVSGTSDATAFDYTTNVVEYGPDGSAAARTLKGSLVGGATLESDPALSGTDLTLVTGSAWQGLGSSPSTTPAASTTTTTIPVPSAANTVYGSSLTVEADSSSYDHGIYIPPGREPGQAVQTCGN